MGVNGIYGLSGSGLDVESMVKVGMLSKQAEYDKMQQKYTQNEWKKSEFLDLYGEVQTFNNSTLSQYKMSGNMAARSATSTAPATVNATANATAPTMSHYVEVGQLATSAYLIGNEKVKGDGKTIEMSEKYFSDVKVSESDADNIIVTYYDGTTATFNKNAAFMSFTVSDGSYDASNADHTLVSSNEYYFTVGRTEDADTDVSLSSKVVQIDTLSTVAEVTFSGTGTVNFNSDNSIGWVFFDRLTASLNNTDTNFNSDLYKLYLERLNEDETFDPDSNAVVFQFYDENYNPDDPTTSDSRKLVGFTYNELNSRTYGRGGFVQTLQRKLDAAFGPDNHIAVTTVNNRLKIYNTIENGSTSEIHFEIDADDFEMGKTFKLESHPDNVISTSESWLDNNTTAFEFFSRVFSGSNDSDTIGEYKTFIQNFINDTPDSEAFKLHISNGTSEAAISILYSDLKANNEDNSLNTLVGMLGGKLTNAGLSSLSVKVENNSLVIKNSNVGSDAKIEFSLKATDFKIGSSNGLLSTNPESINSKILSGNIQSDDKIGKLMYQILGMDSETSYNAYMSSFDETASTETAFTIRFNDGSNTTYDLQITFNDLKATETTVSNFINELNRRLGATNIRFDTSNLYNTGGTLDIKNTETGSDNTISFTIDSDITLGKGEYKIGTYSNPVNTVSETLSNESTKVQEFFKGIFGFTNNETDYFYDSMKRVADENSETVAFTLNFNDGTNSKNVTFKYIDLTNDNFNTESIISKINDELSDTVKIKAEYNSDSNTIQFKNTVVGYDLQYSLTDFNLGAGSAAGEVGTKAEDLQTVNLSDFDSDCSVAQWFGKLNGADEFDGSNFEDYLDNIENPDESLFSIKVSDGISDVSINFSYNDLKDSDSGSLKTLVDTALSGTNIEASYNGQLTFSNNELGGTVSYNLDFGNVEAAAFPLGTRAKIDQTTFSSWGSLFEGDNVSVDTQYKYTLNGNTYYGTSQTALGTAMTDTVQAELNGKLVYTYSFSDGSSYESTEATITEYPVYQYSIGSLNFKTTDQSPASTYADTAAKYEFRSGSNSYIAETPTLSSTSSKNFYNFGSLKTESSTLTSTSVTYTFNILNQTVTKRNSSTINLSNYNYFSDVTDTNGVHTYSFNVEGTIFTSTSSTLTGTYNSNSQTYNFEYSDFSTTSTTSSTFNGYNSSETQYTFSYSGFNVTTTNQPTISYENYSNNSTAAYRTYTYTTNDGATYNYTTTDLSATSGNLSQSTTNKYKYMVNGNLTGEVDRLTTTNGVPKMVTGNKKDASDNDLYYYSDLNIYDTTENQLVGTAIYENFDNSTARVQTELTQREYLEKFSSGTVAFSFQFNDGASNGSKVSITYGDLLADSNLSVIKGKIIASFSGTNIKYSDTGANTLSFYNDKVGSDNTISITISDFQNGANNGLSSNDLSQITGMILGKSFSANGTETISGTTVTPASIRDTLKTYWSDSGKTNTSYKSEKTSDVLKTKLANALGITNTTNYTKKTDNEGTTPNNLSNTDLALNIANFFTNSKKKIDGDTYTYSTQGTSGGNSADLVRKLSNFLAGDKSTDTEVFVYNSTNGTFEYKSDGGYTGPNNEKIAEAISKALGIYNNNGTYKYSASDAGSGAVVTIDGTEYELPSNTYTDTDDGVIYTFFHEGGGVTSYIDKPQQIDITYGQLVKGYTFTDLAVDINGLGTNVRASYDSVQDRFSIYNRKSGSANEIRLTMLTDEAATFFDDLDLKQSVQGNLRDPSEDYSDLSAWSPNFKNGYTSVLSGTDAIAKIDGIDYTGLDANSVTVNGVSYNFTAKTNDLKTGDDGKLVVDSDSPIANAGPVIVNITQDATTIANNVKSFVEKYNTLLSTLYKWYDEKPNSDYKPLTESQKATMKEEQIDKWEEKAKAGLLYHDRTLGNLITEIRKSVTENVEGINGKYTNIFSLGISTTGIKGQLVVDEGKLNAAIADDPDAVYNVFAKLDGGETYYRLTDGTNEIWSKEPSRAGYSPKTIINPDTGEAEIQTKKVERSSFNGIAQRLGDILTNGMKSIKSVSGTTAEVTEDSELNNLLRELQTKMSNFQVLMKAFESRLYKKYDAMESSLALLGAQLNYVTGAFSQ